MNLCERHFKETKKLLNKISTEKIAKWMLEEGYYPEQYVLPPSFKVKSFNFNKSPYYKVTGSKRINFKIDGSEHISLSFPKSQLTDRIYGIIEPRIYHDIIWYIIKEWKLVNEHLFNKDIKIYSYSFPIPVTKKSLTNLGKLRAGRLIYEFLEMSETDLVSEAYKFKFIVTTDIKNFYSSIYTHSIAWALHDKENARADKHLFQLLGTKIDKLLQRANDDCTNGISVGSALSDLISEILLAKIDKECSLKLKKIKYLGVRFKDDYKFLCNSKKDAEFIVKTLQLQMRYYNLTLNENKSEIKELPEGLFRPWIAEYQKFSLRYKVKISYKKFEHTLLNVLQIDQKFSDTGIIDKFLSELVSKKNNLKLKLKKNEVLKTISLLLLLKERRAKAFPQIIAIIEQLILGNKNNKSLINNIKKLIEDILKVKLKTISENIYDLLWLLYLIISNNLFKIQWPSQIDDTLIHSIKLDRQTFFNKGKNIELFTSMKKQRIKIPLTKHIAIFP